VAFSATLTDEAEVKIGALFTGGLPPPPPPPQEPSHRSKPNSSAMRMAIFPDLLEQKWDCFLLRSQPVDRNGSIADAPQSSRIRLSSLVSRIRQ
jgi:hypothetical protein